MLSCATISIAVIVSPCFAQEDQSFSQKTQRQMQQADALGKAQEPFAGDSLLPEVCFDIYRRRMERMPAPILSDDQGDNGEGCLIYEATHEPFG
jgi:hypothetical protein